MGVAVCMQYIADEQEELWPAGVEEADDVKPAGDPGTECDWLERGDDDEVVCPVTEDELLPLLLLLLCMIVIAVDDETPPELAKEIEEAAWSMELHNLLPLELLPLLLPPLTLSLLSDMELCA